MDTKKAVSWVMPAGMLLAAALVGCGGQKILYAPSVQPNKPATAAPAVAPSTTNQLVRIVMPYEKLGKDSTRLLAYYKQGVGQFNGCTYQSSLDDLMERARLVGARTARVISIHAPDDVNSCYFMEAYLYK